MPNYAIYAEESERPRESAEELSKAMSLAAASLHGVTRVIREPSRPVLAIYVSNAKGEAVLI